MYLGTAATVFQVTRLTEASFIVSTPKLVSWLRSIRPKHADETALLSFPAGIEALLAK
jgi:hypothetical protein